MCPYKPLMLTLLLFLPLAGPVQADPEPSPLLPDPKLTPGDTLTAALQRSDASVPVAPSLVLEFDRWLAYQGLYP